MLLMVKKAIGAGICHSIHWYAKTNNKYKKDYDKNKKLSSLKYWDTNILYGWATSQKLAGDKFEWVKDIYNLMKINEKL